MAIMKLTFHTFLVYCITQILGQNNLSKHKIKEKIFTNYDKEIRPSTQNDGPVNVTMDLILYSIVDVNEKEESISLNLWYHVEWQDPSLSWIPSDYGDIMETEVSPTKIWEPDVFLKGVREEKELPKKEDVLCGLLSDGVVHCEFNKLFVTHCDFQIARFPFDNQNCSFEFGSWKYGIKEVSLLTTTSEGNTKFFKNNNEWRLISFKNNRIVKAGSRKEFTKIFYFLVISRKPTHYVMTLFLPSFFICTLALFGLFSPFSSLGERQERVTLGLTMLLTMSVLLLVVSDQMPKTSSGMPPLLGSYILFEFFLGALATCITVGIMHLQQKALKNKSPPDWLQKALRIGNDKISSGTTHENTLYERAKRMWTEKGRESYATNYTTSDQEVEAITDKDFIGPNMMEMVKLLKSCFAHLTTLADYIESKKNEEILMEKWRTICDRIDLVCLITLLVFNLLFSLILLMVYGLTQ